jgi:hypothetical protein
MEKESIRMTNKRQSNMIQTFDKFIYPVLNILRDGKEHTLKSIIEDLKREFSLTDEDAAEQVKGGGETNFTTEHSGPQPIWEKLVCL